MGKFRKSAVDKSEMTRIWPIKAVVCLKIFFHEIILEDAVGVEVFRTRPGVSEVISRKRNQGMRERE